jgi:hypothetical protein
VRTGYLRSSTTIVKSDSTSKHVILLYDTFNRLTGAPGKSWQ